MTRRLIFSRDTRHLWALAAAIVAGCAVFAFARSQLAPASLEQGSAHRPEALAAIAAQPSVLVADTVCLSCHANVGQERAESLHKVVACVHCHGVGSQHVVEARRAAASPDVHVAAALPWDGDFQTKIDLFTTKDRAVCLVCHEDKVGVPEGFKKIDVDEHLEANGAENPQSREACFECHGGHNTAP